MTGQLMVQVVASAASAAKAARLKRGERITARQLHLAVERRWRGRIAQDDEQNSPFGLGPE